MAELLPGLIALLFLSAYQNASEKRISGLQIMNISCCTHRLAAFSSYLHDLTVYFPYVIIGIDCHLLIVHDEIFAISCRTYLYIVIKIHQTDYFLPGTSAYHGTKYITLSTATANYQALAVLD